MEKKYVSSIKINDFSSKGTVSRVLSRKTGRIHHLLSTLERNVFTLLDFDENIMDIKEHFELEDVREIVDDNIDWSKFKDKKTGLEYKITTTFLVTFINGKKIAISCKNSTELYRSNTQLLLEIQRRYWTVKAIPWGIVTNKDIPEVKLKNIKWLLNGSDTYEDKQLQEIIGNTLLNSKGRLKDYINFVSSTYGYKEEVILKTIKCMIVGGELKINLGEEISLRSELSKFSGKG